MSQQIEATKPKFLLQETDGFATYVELTENEFDKTFAMIDDNPEGRSIFEYYAAVETICGRTFDTEYTEFSLGSSSHRNGLTRSVTLGMARADFDLSNDESNNRINNMKMPIDVLTTLYKMHDYNIVHGDIKLKNIVYYASKDRYQLIDFGNAMKLEGTVWFDTSFTYTEGYVPPEGGKSKASDVYAFGITYLKWLLNDEEATLADINKLNSSLHIDIITSCTQEQMENRPTVEQLLNTLGVQPQSDYLERIRDRINEAKELRPINLPNHPLSRQRMAKLLNTLSDRPEASTPAIIFFDAIAIGLEYALFQYVPMHDYKDLADASLALAYIFRGVTPNDNISDKVKRFIEIMPSSLSLPFMNIVDYRRKMGKDEGTLDNYPELYMELLDL